MHVVLLAENWPPRVGGIENYLTHMAGFLPPGSVTVVAPAFAEASTFAKASVDKARFGGGIQEVIRKRFFWPIIKPAWLPLFVWIYRWVKAQRPQIILCGKALFEGLAGYYLKKYRGIPYVVFTYAMEIEQWSQPSPRLRRASFTRHRLERVLRNADRVVYINDATKRVLHGLDVQERQLIKIWPGVDAHYFKQREESEITRILKRYDIRRPYVLTVARLVPRKGVDILVEAFAKLDQVRFGNLRLVVVGEGPERDTLQRMAVHFLLNPSTEARNPSNRVVFLGHVSDEDLPFLYTGAELFALTPRSVKGDREGFGIVYIEAGAAGRAVIGTRSGGATEAVVHKATGLLVQPDSADAVHEALVYLLTHPEEREEIGRQGRERAWHQFRWSKRILLVKGMIDAILAEQTLQSTKRKAQNAQ